MNEFRLLPGTLEDPFCFQSWQQVYNRFFELGQVIAVNGSRFYNLGDSEPAADLRDWPWWRTTDFQWYGWSLTAGTWVRPHPTPPSGSERRLWVGLETDLETYDGGAAGAVNPDGASGPMWEVDHDFDGRSPIGPGLIPDRADTLAVNQNFGTGALLQIGTDVAAHKHLSPWMASTGSSNATTFPWGQGPAIAGSGKVVDDSGANHADRVLPYGEPAPDSTAQTKMNIVHPVRAVFVIKRSARIFIRAI